MAETEQPDIICLQEVKAKKEDFPFAEIEALGYPHIALYSMPGYNGVAILSRTNLSAVEQKTGSASMMHDILRPGFLTIWKSTIFTFRPAEIFPIRLPTCHSHIS
ncbi:MAG: endonuclease/exonuclease/phosphatase family protein [Oscillospiraceae bacterium]